ncbi:alkylated DNA repair protein, partial [Streptomyces sviceus ATCC 29083]
MYPIRRCIERVERLSELHGNRFSNKEYAGFMTAHLQGSLFDQTDQLRLGPLDGIRRTVLAHGAWIDVLPGWLGGSDVLFERLAAEVPWRAERRTMYDHVVDVPRLLAFYGVDDELPHPVVTEAREALTAHYADELGEPFTTAGLCYYRDGRDSVAWHGDRGGRGGSHDTMVRDPLRGRAARPRAAAGAWRRRDAAAAA